MHETTALELMNFYNLKTKDQLITKAIILLEIVTFAKKTNFEIIAKKNNLETRIFV